MIWMTVESSAVTAVSYVRGKRLLYLKFHSGEIYRYFDVPPEQFHEFLAAASKGKYFAHHIRDRFPYEPIGRDDGDSEQTERKRRRRKCRHRIRLG
jgi:hypothetical protein